MAPEIRREIDELFEQMGRFLAALEKHQHTLPPTSYPKFLTKVDPSRCTPYVDVRNFRDRRIVEAGLFQNGERHHIFRLVEQLAD